MLKNFAEQNGTLVGKVVINVHKLISRAGTDVMQAFTIAGEGDTGQVLPSRYLSAVLRLDMPGQTASGLRAPR